jgi:putative membrane protein
MLLEISLIIAALIAGMLTGIFTGLLPGIHINLIASLVLIFALQHTVLSLPLATFIVSLSFTHIIIDFIPTTLLGVPSEENFLSVIPAHHLVKKGEGYEAIRIAFLGILFSIPLIVLSMPLYILFLPKVYHVIESVIPYALVASSLYVIFREKDFVAGAIVFMLAGILGYLTFQLPIKESLLPLLTGLFGLSSLFSSLEQDEKIIKQKLKVKLPPNKHFIRSLLPAFIITPLCSFFPGIGSGHISFFCSEIKEQDSKQFIFLNGLVASMNMALSIVAAYSISRTRSGTAVAVEVLLYPFSLKELLMLMIVCIATIVVMYYIGKCIATTLIRFYNIIPHQKITFITIVFVILINVLMTDSLGFIVLAASTAVGIFAHFLGVRKIQLMGALLLPTMIYYFM